MIFTKELTEKISSLEEWVMIVPLEITISLPNFIDILRDFLGNIKI